MQSMWASLAGRIDTERHKHVAERLAIQVADAERWSTRILAYFQTFSDRPIA